MLQHILFIIIVLAAFSFLGFTLKKIFKTIALLKKPYPVDNHGKRLNLTLKVALGQTKIMRFPLVGFLHAIVFWGFVLITIGSFEMLLDGILGVAFDDNLLNDRVLAAISVIFVFIGAFADVFAYLVLAFIIVFLIRRKILHVKRFEGVEMRHKDHRDAAISLTFILLLMVTLIGMNVTFAAKNSSACLPVSQYFSGYFSGFEATTLHHFEMAFWWGHFMLIMLFMNYLPYSKHFHVFLSLPSVYFSRLSPLTALNNMESVKREVKLMLNPDAASDSEQTEPERFGVKDVEDGTWKNYLDSLTCTQCGRCTSVCPASQTGKKLSPRKIVLDYRRRMEEKVAGLHSKGKTFDDGKSLLGDYTTAEELWACTTCNACAQECPVNIDHPSLIVDLRRFLFMEQSAAPSAINTMFTNIENNGAPWQYSAADRLNWADNLPFTVPNFADLATEGKTPDILFWVGSACSYDVRAKKISQAFASILEHCKINYAVLGTEETDTGDHAKRSGNEFLFQMQASQIVATLNQYQIKNIVTCDPHDFNTLKNEYPDLDGKYNVLHSSEFVAKLISEGKLKLNTKTFENKRITYHDPCYLGRGNGIFDAPREILSKTNANLLEMKRSQTRSLCCGAGGGQMFKEAEKGTMEVYEMRTNDVLDCQPNIVAVACPFCMTMILDGLKMKDKQDEVEVLDIVEIVAKSMV